MEQVIGLVMNSVIVIFIVAFGAHMYAVTLVNKGHISRGRTFTWIAFLASLLLVVVYAASFLLSHSFFSLVLVVLWGYFTWVDWKLLGKLESMRE